MKNIGFICLLAACSVPLSCSCDKNSEEGDVQEKVVFMDDFNEFNDKVWTKEVHPAGWTNNELQSYDASRVSVGNDGGKSVLILTAERRGDKVYSGRINSKGKRSFRTGTVSASIKLPKTDGGLWPAFWLMGDNTLHWPECGEIDIMEMGEKQGIANGTSETWMNTAIHYGPDVAGHEQEYHAANVAASLQDGNYHLYTLEKTETSMTVAVDGNIFYTFDISEASGRQDYFKGNFFILFNLAVGGDFPGIWDVSALSCLKDGEKANMYIDWVKITN